jgi:hypothetical protein
MGEMSSFNLTSLQEELDTKSLLKMFFKKFSPYKMKSQFVTNLLLVIFLTLTFDLRAQQYPQNYFGSPLDIPLLLSGNFGELRSNHFHSGIDLKTQGVTGKRVLAAADGYVSRIKVSPFGYGKALYITHPNGYTTVYAHLDRFEDAIEAYTRKRQYNQERFEIDLFPGKGELEVRKGEVIAFSGNTGGSGGPHLHFEIRETASEKPVNPMLFGIGPSDTKAPNITGLQVHPLEVGATVLGRNEVKQIPLNMIRPGVWTAAPIRAGGAIGFSVNAYDQQDGSQNQNGVYRMALYIDEQLVYQFEAEKFAFSETRYINAHIDYARFSKLKNRYKKAFVEPGNKLSMYPVQEDRGVLKTENGKVYQIRIELSDLSDNLSMISFEVHGESRMKVEVPPENYLWHHQPYAFQTEYFRVQIPAGTLYDDRPFDYYVKPGNAKVLTDLHVLLSEEIPAHQYFDMSIGVNERVLTYGNKACMVQVMPDGKLSYEGGNIQGGFLTSKVRSFGAFALTADTVAPEVVPINLREGANMRGQKQIRIRIADALSGIASYRGTINGKWILMEYDAKNNLLTYDFDHVCEEGNNTFILTVTDKRGNISKVVLNFQR